VEFAFEKARMHEWFADIKRLIANDLKGLPGIGKEGRCLNPGYYVMRFGKTADSHVGMAAHLKEPIYVQVRAWGGGAGASEGWLQEGGPRAAACCAARRERPAARQARPAGGAHLAPLPARPPAASPRPAATNAGVPQHARRAVALRVGAGGV
jgi:hypothetical protein